MDLISAESFESNLRELQMVFERPVFWYQVGAIILIFLASWGANWLLERAPRWLARRSHRTEEGATPNLSPWRSRTARWARAISFTIFPIIGILLSSLAILLFQWNYLPYQLLSRTVTLYWLLLIYRLIAGVAILVFSPTTAALFIRRILSPTFIVVFVLVVSSALDDITRLDSAEFFTFQEQTITLGAVVNAGLVLYIFYAIAMALNDVMTPALQRIQAQPGVANTIKTVTRYTILGVGVLAAFSVLGFSLSAILIVFGGLSVGIGFGLQELVSNFISGIVLMFDNTVRPGDIVDVATYRGAVERLGIRATVLRTVDNAEVVVPNKTLFVSPVTTFTYTDTIVRRTIDVGVGRESDPETVRDALRRVALRHGDVLAEPQPEVYFLSFGASTLQFQLAFHLATPAVGLRVSSDLHYMIWKEFAALGIAIPYPQQDVHLHTVEPASR
jgi:small-conductance mechanosensitive channel